MIMVLFSIKIFLAKDIKRMIKEGCSHYSIYRHDYEACSIQYDNNYSKRDQKDDKYKKEHHLCCSMFRSIQEVAEDININEI